MSVRRFVSQFRRVFNPGKEDQGFLLVVDSGPELRIWPAPGLWRSQSKGPFLRLGGEHEAIAAEDEASHHHPGTLAGAVAGPAGVRGGRGADRVRQPDQWLYHAGDVRS